MKKRISILMPALLACAVSALSITPAFSEELKDVHGNPTQPVPDVPPDIDVISHSLPGDCKTINDEMARLEKFAKNPKATEKQIAANQKRVDKLKAARVDAQCDEQEALQAESAHPAPAHHPAKK